jgi:outer membrane protein OmpA-like peptidoglycan-associated protein
LATLAFLCASTPAFACTAFPIELSFAPGSSSMELSPPNSGMLDSFAASYLSTRSTSPVRIVGMFDTRRDAGASMTLALGRSRNVQDYLAGRGIPFDQMRIVLLGEETSPDAAGAAAVRLFREDPVAEAAPGQPVPVC